MGNVRNRIAENPHVVGSHGQRLWYEWVIFYGSYVLLFIRVIYGSVSLQKQSLEITFQVQSENTRVQLKWCLWWTPLYYINNYTRVIWWDLGKYVNIFIALASVWITLDLLSMGLNIKRIHKWSHISFSHDIYIGMAKFLFLFLRISHTHVNLSFTLVILHSGERLSEYIA